MKPLIKVERVGKLYHLGSRPAQYVTLRDALAMTVGKSFLRLCGKKASLRAASLAKEEAAVLWALRDVSFTVGQGELFGIIGTNGSGKSTLLQILSKVTPPTEGPFIIPAQTSCVLDIGAGFHPDLSGRENIYFQGSVLGMSRSEIHRQLEVIIDFSGVEQFLDVPVKFYSSGMMVRLGFSIASHLRSDVILIDEALQVGDKGFQEKCARKVKELLAEGRTLLCVTHEFDLVEKLSKQLLYLRRGTVVDIGNAPDVIARYKHDLSIQSGV